MQREAGAELSMRAAVSWPGFLLDLVRGELLDSRGRPTGLRAQALQVLLVLGEQPGQVVGKDELMRRVWGDLVVTDDSLVQAIGDIRRTIGDQRHERVRTVPRRGYLLVADEPAAGPSESGAGAVSGRSHLQKWVFSGGALLLVMIALATTFLTNRAVPVARSLAILPFEASGGVDDWFADAVTGDLTTKASRWPSVFVIGRGTMQSYKGKGTDPRMVARELGVAYVLTGHLRRDSERIRFDVVLIDGRSGAAVWAEQIDVDRAGVQDSIGDIAGGIAKTLMIQWGGAIGERATRLQPNQVEAEDLAMQGHAIMLRSLGPDNFERARRLFEQAIERDPRSVRGLAGVSLTNSMGVIFHWAADKEGAIRRSEETLARLAAIDPDSVLTFAARASIANMRADWEALHEIATDMIGHYPNDPTSHHHRCSSRLRLGRFDEAIPSCERALRISPRDSRAPIWNGLIGMNEYMRGRYAEAAERARTMVSGNPNVPFYSLLLAASLAETGRGDEARRIVEEFRTRNPTFDSAGIAARWPATNAQFVAGRDRLTDRVRKLGLP